MLVNVQGPFADRRLVLAAQFLQQKFPARVDFLLLGKRPTMGGCRLARLPCGAANGFGVPSRIHGVELRSAREPSQFFGAHPKSRYRPARFSLKVAARPRPFVRLILGARGPEAEIFVDILNPDPLFALDSIHFLAACEPRPPSKATPEQGIGVACRL